jgi:hypothetical protein
LSEGTTRVQLSIKFGANGSLYAIVEAPTAEQMLEEAGKLMDAAAFINQVGDTIQSELIVREQLPQTEVVGNRASPTPAPAPQNPFGPQGENCAHGVPRVWVDKSKRTDGKPFKAWFCDVKNDPNLKQCDPVFVR